MPIAEIMYLSRVSYEGFVRSWVERWLSIADAEQPEPVEPCTVCDNNESKKCASSRVWCMNTLMERNETTISESKAKNLRNRRWAVINQVWFGGVDRDCGYPFAHASFRSRVGTLRSDDFATNPL